MPKQILQAVSDGGYSDVKTVAIHNKKCSVVFAKKMLTTLQIVRSQLIRNVLRQKSFKRPKSISTAFLPSLGTLDPNTISHEELYQYSIEKVCTVILFMNLIFFMKIFDDVIVKPLS